MEPKSEPFAVPPPPAPEGPPAGSVAPATGVGASSPPDEDEEQDENEGGGGEGIAGRPGPGYLRLAFGIVVMAGAVLAAVWVYEKQENVLSTVAVSVMGLYLAIRASGLLTAKK